MTGDSRAPERSVVLTFDDGTASVHETAFPLLRKYNKIVVLFIAPRFHAEKKTDGTGGRLLTWEELSELEESGFVDIQSHTLEHRYVPRWPEFVPLAGVGPGDLPAVLGKALPMEEDFGQAREILGNRLKKSVEHLAFPKFFGTEEALRIGQACGYRSFWWGTLPHRPGNSPGDSPLRVVRLEAQFLRRLPGDNRRPLSSVLSDRYLESFQRLWRKVS
jgi:peptidoglycan/xylan/chitin deacetylase (PgdA/CDA1 family)